MEDEEYHEIFEWLKSKESSGGAKKLAWPARILKTDDKDGEAKIGNMKRGFREKALKFHISVSDGLLYRNPERKHKAISVLKKSDSANVLISAHGMTNEHRGIKDM